MKEFQDKIVLVTGASRGIGAGIAALFAERGAYVIINYARSADQAQSLLTKIESAGGKGEVAGFDVGNFDAVEEHTKALLTKHGKIDILVNNAGIAKDNLLVRTSQDDWQQTIQTNLSSAFYLSRSVGKAMMKARSGRIINISSVIGEMGNAGQAAYSASKAGMIGLTKSLARELGSRSITVNAVAPGYIITEMTDALSDEQKAGISSAIALGSLGTVEDVAESVAFLASEKAKYITGHVLSVNGGMYM